MAARFFAINSMVMNTTPATPMTPVMHAGRCLGFLLNRGREGVEAFTRETQSAGCYPTEYEAISALLNPKGALDTNLVDGVEP
jgi:hypothetical protein